MVWHILFLGAWHAWLRLLGLALGPQMEVLGHLRDIVAVQSLILETSFRFRVVLEA